MRLNLGCGVNTHRVHSQSDITDTGLSALVNKNIIVVLNSDKQRRKLQNIY